MNRWTQVVILIFGVVSGCIDNSPTPAITVPLNPNATTSIPDILFVPTPHDVVDRMLDLACVKEGDVVYDLGCGDGRIVVAAAKKYGCRCVGFDIDSGRIEESERNVKNSGVESLVEIKKRDLFKANLHQASVVVLYLSPKANIMLLPQLERLAPNSRIVSHQFNIPTIKPDKVLKVDSKEDHHKHTLFLWITPLKKRTASDHEPPISKQ